MGANATAQVTAGAVNLSWREKLAAFARSRETALLFGAILPLALVLRLISLGSKSFDEDEIVSALLARGDLPEFWSRVSHSETNMVLYFAVLRFWNHLGQSEFALRSFSVIIALAAVLALYSLGTRAFGRQVGTLGALLLAINGFHIQHSQYARSYSLLMFLVTLSSLFFLQGLRDGSRKNWKRYIVASTLAIYAHLFAVFVLVAHWVFFLLLARKWAPWRRLVPSTAAIAFLALPMELFVVLSKMGYLHIYWVPRTTMRSVYDLLGCFAGRPPQVFLPPHGQVLLLCAYSIPMVLAVLALARSCPWSIDRTETWYLTFFATWLAVPILLTLAISMRKPVFVDKYLIICLPPFVLLGSYGFSRFRRGWPVIALLCVIAGLTARGLLTYYKSPGQDWRGIAQYILSNQQPGDAAAFFPDYYSEKLEYYLQKEAAKLPGSVSSNLALLGHSADTSFGPLLQSLPSRYDRVWFIGRADWTKAADLQKHSITATLAAEFPGPQKEKRFPGGLVVILYSK